MPISIGGRVSALTKDAAIMVPDTRRKVINPKRIAASDDRVIILSYHYDPPLNTGAAGIFPAW
jgi:hypothetical protein